MIVRCSNAHMQESVRLRVSSNSTSMWMSWISMLIVVDPQWPSNQEPELGVAIGVIVQHRWPSALQCTVNVRGREVNAADSALRVNVVRERRVVRSEDPSAAENRYWASPACEPNRPHPNSLPKPSTASQTRTPPSHLAKSKTLFLENFFISILLVSPGKCRDEWFGPKGVGLRERCASGPFNTACLPPQGICDKTDDNLLQMSSPAPFPVEHKRRADPPDRSPTRPVRPALSTSLVIRRRSNNVNSHTKT